MTSITALAAIYHVRRKYAQAEPLYVSALGLFRRIHWEEAPDALTAMANLAQLYKDQGKHQLSEPLYTKCLSIQKHVLGENHRRTIHTMNGLADLYRLQGKYSESEAMYVKALDAPKHGLGTDHPIAISSVEGLARTYLSEGKYAKAEPVYGKALAIRRRVLGGEHPDTLRTLEMLGKVRLRNRQYVDAEVAFRTVQNGYERTNSTAGKGYCANGLLGGSLVGQRRYAESEDYLISGYQGLIKRKPEMTVDDRDCLVEIGQWIVQLYRDWGKPEKAVEWKRELGGKTNQMSSEPPSPGNQ